MKVLIAILLVISMPLMGALQTEARSQPFLTVQTPLPNLFPNLESSLVLSNSTNNSTDNGLGGAVIITSPGSLGNNLNAQTNQAQLETALSVAAQAALAKNAKQQSTLEGAIQTRNEQNELLLDKFKSFELGTTAAEISADLKSIFSKCDTAKQIPPPDYILYEVSGTTSLGQLENYIKDNDKLTLELTADLKVFTDAGYLTDIQILGSESPFLDGKILIGEGPDMRDIRITVNNVETHCGNIPSTEKLLKVDNNQPHLKMNSNNLNPISSTCSDSSDYAKFTMKGQSSGLSEVRINDRGEITFYILLDSQQAAPPPADPLTILKNSRTLAAVMVVNQFQDNEKVFDFDIDRIMTTCNQASYVGDFIDIGSKEESDDPLRFFS